MAETKSTIRNQRRGLKGVSVPEAIVALLVGAIIVVLAIPHFFSIRQLKVFSDFQQKVTLAVSEARSQAIKQKKAVSFRYDEKTGRAFIWGGSFGPVGDARNKQIDMSVEDLDPSDVKFGQPPGITVERLADTARPAKSAGGSVDLTFQPDGTMIDKDNYPDSRAIFFYHDKYRLSSAFAVSVLGGSGRVKSFKYRESVNDYIE